MYDASWYDTVVPAKPTATHETTKHKRRESLLQQPHEEDHADIGPTVAAVLPKVVEEKPGSLSNGPPKATLARRARSYSDFYDVVTEYLEKENIPNKEKRKAENEIKTELDFGNWYNAVSDELLEASHEEYQQYRDQLHISQSHLQSLIDGTTSALDTLSSLSDSFKAVEAQTGAFQRQCEGIVSDQQRITTVADEIADNIHYYAYLEPTTRRLNAPGAGKYVRSKEFSEMLGNLDNCLEYMQAHPGHKESATYLSRYRQLLTRGLTLIRVHFTNALRERAADVSQRIADKQLNDTTMSALLYAKFRIDAPDLKQLALEIQNRAVLPKGAEAGAEAEYQSLLNELYQSYSATRGRLILPLVAKKMNEIAIAPSTSKDLVAFARSSISYIRGICLDEYDLWKEWFDGEGGMYDFLEAICEPLYDYLRPRTIHETKILKLCELCTMIQSRYMEDEEDDELPVDVPRLDFTSLFLPALEDAQTRLVFLTLEMLRKDIEYYKPKPEDLEYPPKHNPTATGTKNGPVLSGRKQSNGSLPGALVVVDEDQDGDAQWNYTESALKDWYPTLRRAIWLLSKIYRLVNSTVFDDLAHQIVHQTTLSLHFAATQISTRSSPTDAQLFLIKHLLTLKQQIVAFDIEFVTPEVSFDFSNVTNTFFELQSTRGALFNPANWLKLVQGGLLPRVVENMLDAKVELDGRLRTAINDLVRTFASRMTAAVSADAIKKSSFDAVKATKAVRVTTDEQVPFLRQKLAEYLDDARTKETLVAAVQDQVQLNYEEFWAGYSATTGGGKTKGKGREDGVWDRDTFDEWCTAVFNVGRAAMGAIGEEADDDGDGEGRFDSRSRSVSRSGST